MMALFARLKIAHKLLISSAVLALPLIVLLYSVLSGYEGISSAKKELEGARRLEPLRRMAEDVRVHQRLDYLRLKGDLRWEAQRNEAARRIDEVLAGEAAPQLAARWQRLRTRPPATPEESVAAHQQLATAVQDLVREVGDFSTLVLDPDMDSYYLMDLAVVLLPEAQVTIADAAMLANEAALGEPVSQRDLLQFAVYASTLENFTLPQVRYAVETSLREDRNFYGVSESLQQNLPGLLSRYQAALAAGVEQMRRYSRMPDASVTAPQLAALLDRAAQVGWDFRGASIAELRVLLEKRISVLRWKLAAALGSGILALALAGLIFTFIARSITVPLEEVVKLASDVENGRLKEARERLNNGAARSLLASSGCDEICQLVCTIDHAIGRLDSLLAERKQAEQALREREQQLQSILDNSPAAIYVKDPDGRYLTINRHYAEAIGATADRIIGKTAHDFFPKERADAIRAHDRGVLETDSAMEFEETIPQKDGLHIYLAIKFPLFDSSGAAYAVCGISTDITRRKQMESAEHFLATISNAIPDPVFVKDEQHRWVFLNDACCEFVRHRREELIGKSDYDFFPKEEADAFGAKDNLVFETGKEDISEETFTDPRGTTHVVQNRKSLYTDLSGEKFIVGVLRDITDRKQAEEERELLLLSEQEARQEAEAANRAKDEFLAVVSHELRTPLSPILMWTHMLKSDNDPSQIPRAMEMIERNVKVQLRLIEDLLDLNRTARGQLNLELAEHDIAAILRSAVESVQGEAAKKRITLDLAGAGEPLRVQADPGRLQQVFTNILFNAVKFTPEGGAIQVRLADEGNNAVVKFRDTGQGIAPEFLPHVFEMFRQQEGGTLRSHSGLGIGLALAKNLVELHGGYIEVESEGVGSGTEVTVRLLLLPSAPEIEIPKIPAASAKLSPALQGLSILLVEDSEDTRETTECMLKKLGAQVCSATNGREALDAMADADPDLILCDLVMPEMDGSKFMEELRREHGLMHPPVIAVSGLTTEADRQLTHSAGFAGHLNKPFDDISLVAAIRSAQKHVAETECSIGISRERDGASRNPNAK